MIFPRVPPGTNSQDSNSTKILEQTHITKHTTLIATNMSGEEGHNTTLCVPSVRYYRENELCLGDELKFDIRNKDARPRYWSMYESAMPQYWFSYLHMPDYARSFRWMYT